MMNIDPGKSRIYKILAKFCPKFLDLYASIYGNMFFSLPEHSSRLKKIGWITNIKMSRYCIKLKEKIADSWVC